MPKSREGAPPGFQTSRRSSRKPASFPVWLRNEGRGPIWEEETETHVVSRFGAGLHCRHSIGAESVVVIVRKDNGQRTYARVRYSRYDADGMRELGIEFIDKDNFWGLDWNSSEPVPSHMERFPTPSGAAPGESDLESRTQASPDETCGERID